MSNIAGLHHLHWKTSSYTELYLLTAALGFGERQAKDDPIRLLSHSPGVRVEARRSGCFIKRLKPEPVSLCKH